MDIESRRGIWKYIKELRGSDKKITLFLSTHYLDEADELCDRIAIIHNGEIKACDTPDNLKSSLNSDVVDFTFIDGTSEEIGRALNVIKSLDFVEEVKRQGSNRFEAAISNREAAIPKIIYATATTSARINFISLKRPSLEEVFIHYTKSEFYESNGAKKDPTGIMRLLKPIERVWKTLRGGDRR